LLEGEAQELRSLFLLEEGPGDAGLVVGAADAVGAVGLGVDGLVGASLKGLAAEGGDRAGSWNAWRDVDPAPGLAAD
jgi:hypothetical protein